MQLDIFTEINKAPEAPKDIKKDQGSNGLSRVTQIRLDNLKMEYIKHGPVAWQGFIRKDAIPEAILLELGNQGLIIHRNCAASGVYELSLAQRREIAKKQIIQDSWRKTGCPEFAIKIELKELNIEAV